jgi:hypothetical protein
VPVRLLLRVLEVRLLHPLLEGEVIVGLMLAIAAAESIAVIIGITIGTLLREIQIILRRLGAAVIALLVMMEQESLFQKIFGEMVTSNLVPPLPGITMNLGEVGIEMTKTVLDPTETITLKTTKTTTPKVASLSPADRGAVRDETTVIVKVIVMGG